MDDPTRFKNSRTVGADFGLTPRRLQFGETDNPGWISHGGVCRCSSHALRGRERHAHALDHLVEFEGLRVKLMKTKGRRRAIVAVARKIAVVLHRMWADGTELRLGSEAAA